MFITYLLSIIFCIMYCIFLKDDSDQLICQDCRNIRISDDLKRMTT
jgi:hypothetical protein